MNGCKKLNFLYALVSALNIAILLILFYTHGDLEVDIDFMKIVNRYTFTHRHRSIHWHLC